MFTKVNRRFKNGDAQHKKTVSGTFKLNALCTQFRYTGKFIGTTSKYYLSILNAENIYTLQKCIDIRACRYCLSASVTD